MRSKLTICIGAAVLLAAAAAVTTPEPQRAQERKHTGSSELEITVEQLPAENGLTPAGLRCGTAQLSSPNTIEGTTCVVRNNTDKRVSAVTLAYSVVTEKDGKETSDISYLTIDTFIHPDLRADRRDRHIPPHGELPIRDISTTYEDAVVKGMKAWIDYVEFEDRDTAGPNKGGSQIVRDIRAGAGRYKEWLARQVGLGERSSGALARLVEKNPSSEELGTKNGNEEQGVTFYKDYARKIVKDKGAAALVERLRSTPAPRNK